MKNLTPSERKVLFCLIKGYKNKEIAERLNLSIHTIKSNLESIYMKLGVNSRLQAALAVIKDD